MKEIKGYTDYSTIPDEQDGHYLVLKLTSSDGTITTTKTGDGASGIPVSVTDGYCVYRITNASTQKITVTATNEKGENSITYDLSGLTLESTD